MTITSVNPSTERKIKTYHLLTSDQILRKIAKAQKAYEEWRYVPWAQKSILLQTVAKILITNSHKYATLITTEMGKPIIESTAEVEKCASVCKFYATHAKTMLKNEVITTNAHYSYVRREPLGILLAVMPWNFPFWQVLRFAAPALMAGNTVLLKHASNVPGCSLALQDLFEQAKLPVGTFQSLLIAPQDIQQIIHNEHVRAVTLTGSEHAGSIVASQAATKIKRAVLELGGSDPFIVLEDADIASAAKTAAQARLLNGGQSCIAAKRFLIQKNVYAKFVSSFTNEVAKKHIGDPLDPTVHIGPLATKNILETIDAQVKKSVQMGARIELGGGKIQGTGMYFEPTILTNIAVDMPVWNEETFGPVAPIMSFSSDFEAVQLANTSVFGLGASLWTKSAKRRNFFIDHLECGNVFVNTLVKSDPRMPFGGIKNSGYGRELSHYGIVEFINIKTVWIEHM